VNQWESFNRGFFGKKLPEDAVYTGRNVTFSIGPTNRAEIKLATQGHADHHVCYRVCIVSAAKGPITEMPFVFRDELSRRIDNRPDYRGDFYVWGDAEWYIAVPHPEEVEGLADKIMRFIDLYRGA
jgi:hypothetical protein